MFVYNTPYPTQPDYLSDRRRVSLGVPDDTHSTGVKRVKVLVPIPMDAGFARHSGKAELRRMYEDFFGAWQTIVHKDFTCTVDETNGRIAACFEAVLTGHDGSVTRLNNTNFWRIRDGKFQEVTVYMSGENPLV